LKEKNTDRKKQENVFNFQRGNINSHIPGLRSGPYGLQRMKGMEVKPKRRLCA